MIQIAITCCHLHPLHCLLPPDPTENARHACNHTHCKHPHCKHRYLPYISNNSGHSPIYMECVATAGLQHILCRAPVWIYMTNFSTYSSSCLICADFHQMHPSLSLLQHISLNKLCHTVLCNPTVEADKNAAKSGVEGVIVEQD